MPHSPQPELPGDAGAASARWGYLLAVLVLLAGLLLVALYVDSAERRELESAQARFVARTDELTALLVQRLGNYELMTRGGAALFATVRPGRQQWRNYVDGLDLPHRFPAVVGLGFAAYASPGQLADLQRTLRDAGEGLFTVFPHGARDHYGAILLLEPGSPENLAAIGYDMYSHPVRRAAMEAAADAGQARLSAQVFLVQDSGLPKPAVMLFQPVYRGGGMPGSVAARREALQGWVYLPFRVADFVDATLRDTPRRVGLRIFDASGRAERQLYASPPEAAPAFVHSRPITLYGRRWRLEYASEPLAAVEQRFTGLRTVRLVGMLASLLLFGIVVTLARTQSRAERLAARMSESYRRSERRFRSAVQYSTIGMALLDHSGRIVEANPALAAILGTRSERLVGTAFGSHFVGGGDEMLRSREMQALGEGAYRTTRTLQRSDGDTRQAQMTFAPVAGEIGQDITRLVQVEDVTDRVRAEAQVLALNRSLEARVAARTRELTQANEELESFAYSVSHDLRAPLRAIEGFSRLLAERHAEGIDASGRDYLARVRAAAGRMDTLIESLLKMSRLSRGDLRPLPLDLSRMAAEVVAELRAADPGRDVAVEIAPGLHAIADAGLLQALLQNLLGNAWKFTRGRAGARIEMGRNDAGEFFVRDNGAGFSPAYAEKLFRPFQRLHSQDEFAGHGIGLASVRRIVERHGGGVRAEGVPGQGATFYFALPGSPE